MSRHLFGGSIADYAVAAGGQVTVNNITGNELLLVPGVQVTFWDAPSSGNQITDLTDLASMPITSVTADTNGAIPQFYGPDGVRQLWGDAAGGAGPRRLMVPTDIGPDLTTLENTVAETTLGSLADVSVPSPADRQVLRYSASANQWDAETPRLADLGLDWVSVKDPAYGAKGDGVADDTAAIQAAINAAPVVYFPPGTYLTGTLTPAAGTTLLGSASGGFGTPPPAGSVSTLRLKSGTNGHLLTGGSGISWVQVRYLHLDGNKANNTAGDLIHISDAASSEQANWFFTDCFLENSAGIGIYAGVNRIGVIASRCNIIGSTGDGARLLASDCTLQNCGVGSSGGNGVTIGAGAWVTHLNNCDIWSSGLAGVDSTAGASMVIIVGCGIDRHQRQGVAVANGQVTIVGCVLHSNSQAGNNTYPHVSLDTGGDVIVIGCVFGTDNLANNPNYAMSASAGAVREWGNKLIPGSTVTGYVNDATKVFNTLTGSLTVDVASQINIGGSTSTSSVAVRRTNGTDSAFSCRVGSETASRFTIDALGDMAWSSGASSSDITLVRSVANTLTVGTADFRIATAGRGLMVAEGTNAKQGVANLTAGQVTVSNTAVTANSRIQLTIQTPGGTVGSVYVSARAAGTSFTIKSTSTTDTSTVAYLITEPS